MFRTTQCRACGAEIGFIKTVAGKTVPVDAKSIYFMPDPLATESFVMMDGTVKRGRHLTEDTAPLNGEPEIGYISHFATCPEADRFRKARKSDRKKG